MKSRPYDDDGDVLPVLHISDLVDNQKTVARLITMRLRILTGQWWENRSEGCMIMELLNNFFLTETETQAISNYLTSYIAQTEGVVSVEDVKISSEGRRFFYTCNARTYDGSIPVEYSYSA